jgi:hypothetical protein
MMGDGFLEECRMRGAERSGGGEDEDFWRETKEKGRGKEGGASDCDNQCVA